MKRKWISFAIVLILLLAIPLTGCASTRAIVAEEGTSRPLPICNPVPSPQIAPEPGTIPLDYITEVWTERDTETGITSPIAWLTLQNTDNQSGQFTVRIFFYASDKFTGDSQKTTLDLPSQGLLTDIGEKYTYEQVVSLSPDGMQTFSFSAPEVDMFNDYWFWRYEIVPPVKSSFREAREKEED